jgi:hypothetical protein
VFRGSKRIAMTYDGYQVLIKRLDGYAKRQPKAYRARVMLLPLLGYAYMSC